MSVSEAIQRLLDESAQTPGSTRREYGSRLLAADRQPASEEDLLALRAEIAPFQLTVELEELWSIWGGTELRVEHINFLAVNDAVPYRNVLWNLNDPGALERLPGESWEEMSIYLPGPEKLYPRCLIPIASHSRLVYLAELGRDQLPTSRFWVDSVEDFGLSLLALSLTDVIDAFIAEFAADRLGQPPGGFDDYLPEVERMLAYAKANYPPEFLDSLT